MGIVGGVKSLGKFWCVVAGAGLRFGVQGLGTFCVYAKSNVDSL